MVAGIFLLSPSKQIFLVSNIKTEYKIYELLVVSKIKLLQVVFFVLKNGKY